MQLPRLTLVYTALFLPELPFKSPGHSTAQVKRAKLGCPGLIILYSRPCNENNKGAASLSRCRRLKYRHQKVYSCFTRPPDLCFKCTSLLSRGAARALEDGRAWDDVCLGECVIVDGDLIQLLAPDRRKSLGIICYSP